MEGCTFQREKTTLGNPADDAKDTHQLLLRNAKTMRRNSVLTLAALLTILSTGAAQTRTTGSSPSRIEQPIRRQPTRQLQETSSISSSSLVSLELINSKTQGLESVLQEGLIIESADPEFNLRVKINGTAARIVRSVKFGYNIKSNYQVENKAPYTLCSNPPPKRTPLFSLGARIFPNRIKTAALPAYPKCDVLGYGEHRISVTTYAQPNAQGAAMADGTITLSFSIVAPRPPSATPIITTTDRNVDDLNSTDINGDVDSSSSFSIQLELTGIPSEDLTLFTTAARKWQSVITGELVDVASRTLTARTDGCTFPSIIDDVYVCAQYQAIDGPSTILGFAGPEYVRTVSQLPISGNIVFDLADMDSLKSKNGLLTTIMHEMGHVIGIGTLWDNSNVADPAPNCEYIGTHAKAEYKAISGCNTVPTERGGNPGTTCVHWDEKCMHHELMTGYYAPGAPGPLSRITIGSLHDLGYTVDYSKADPYSAKDLGPGCTCAARRNRNLRQGHHMMDMAHGETVPLGFLHKTPAAPQRHRRLSDEAHAMAVEAGLEYLASHESTPKEDKLLQPGVTYIGDKVISVMVEDAGEVFGIVVRSDMRR